MTNHQPQTTRKFGPASTSDVLPPVQRYAPACRAEAPSEGRTCRADSSRPSSPAEAETPASSGSPLTHHGSCLEPSNHQLSTLNHQPIRRTRNGKIARLPHPVRDMVNRMLRNNIPHSKIAEALTEHGVTATQRNISNWKTRGGYRDWCDQQDRAVETHLLQDNLVEHLRTTDATQLSEVGLQLAATQLSQFFLKQNASEQLTADPEKLATAVNALCRLNRQLYRLQKYRDDSARELGYKHNPERLKREVEKDLEITRNVYSAEKLGQTIHDHDIPHRNFIPKNPRAYTAQGDSDQDSAPPTADPLRALSNFASLLKNGASSKPAAPALMPPKPG